MQILPLWPIKVCVILFKKNHQCHKNRHLHDPSILFFFFFFFPETLPKSQHPKTDQCSLNLASVVAPTDSTSAPWILMGGCTACCVSHITALRRYKMAERNQAPSSTWWTWASPELVWTNTHLCNHSAMLKSPAVVLIWWHSNPRADWSLLSLSCLVSVLCTISLKAIRNS